MKLRHLGAAALALAILAAAGSAADAKRYSPVRYCWQAASYGWNGRVAKCQPRQAAAKPRRWCGWFARQMVGQDPGPDFNLARNWARWGRPASPGVGVMVVWSHHVGMITGRTTDGRWIVKSGNDGHAVRERPRSVAGAIAFRQG